MHSRRIALLGGGQLGRMFLENALRYGVHVSVLDPDPECPCASLAQQFVCGRFDDAETVLRFAAGADVVGLEIEHVSVEALDVLKQRGITVIPDPQVLRTINDKGLQKAFYRTNGIPTASYALVEKAEDVRDHAHLLPAYLKARKGGYDGKGVQGLDHVPHGNLPLQGPCVLEQRVDLDRELAVLVVRSASGGTRTYDAVEMVFDPRYNLVSHLLAPARIPVQVAERAQALARRVSDAFAAPGLYAVELFLTRKGELLVNETAPRVHNSGHHTIEACLSSQFDQLLRLYMGWPMGSTQLLCPAAMINLVGGEGSGPAHLGNFEHLLNAPGTYVHWYAKKETRPGRKMGHVTVLPEQNSDLDKAIQEVKVHSALGVSQVNRRVT
jgi:5-(carboxyamino)imidazole ribonucleotide synthase